MSENYADTIGSQVLIKPQKSGYIEVQWVQKVLRDATYYIDQLRLKTALLSMFHQC